MRISENSVATVERKPSKVRLSMKLRFVMKARKQPGDARNGTVFVGSACDLALRRTPLPKLKVQRVGHLLMAAHARASCPAIATSGARNRIEICRVVPL